MVYNMLNWWLTKHGRQRFIERVGYMSDGEILATAAKGYILGDPKYMFIWAPDRKYPLSGKRLVTVKIRSQQSLGEKR